MKRKNWAVIAAVVSLAGFCGAAHAAMLVADYQFNGDLSSSVAGAPNLTNPGTGMNNAPYAGSADLTTTPGVAYFTQRTGFGLDVSTILGASYVKDYTVAMLVKVPDPNNWRGLSYGSPSYKNNDDGFQIQPGGKLTLWDNGDHTVGANGAIAADTWVQVLYTVSTNAGDSAKYDLLGMIGKGPGAVSGSFTGLSTGHHAFNLLTTDMKIDFFRDNYADVTQGAVDRIQVYRGALTVDEAKALDLAAVAEVPEPASLGVVGLGLAALLRRRR